MIWPATVPSASATSVATDSTVSGAISSLTTTSRTERVGERAVDERGGDGLVEDLCGVQLGLQLLRLVLQAALVLLEVGDLTLDVGQDRLVEGGRPDDDPERDRQEDGDQRHQVVTEVDHEKRFSSQNTKLFHWSNSRSM